MEAMAEPYVNLDYYEDDYEGSSVEESNFSRFAKRASDVIDAMTDYKIREAGMDKYAEHVQELIKKATCAQIEYYQIEGIETDTTGNSRSGRSLSIGDFSYSNQNNSGGRQSKRVAPNTLMYLEGTGLLRKRSVRIGVI